MQKFGFQEKKMSITAETCAADMRAWIAEAADYRRGRRKTVLSEIAREAGMHAQRVAAYFYGKVRAPTAHEWEMVKRWRQQEVARRLQQIDADRAHLLAERQRNG